MTNKSFRAIIAFCGVLCFVLFILLQDYMDVDRIINEYRALVTNGYQDINLKMTNGVHNVDVAGDDWDIYEKNHENIVRIVENIKHDTHIVLENKSIYAIPKTTMRTSIHRENMEKVSTTSPVIPGVNMCHESIAILSFEEAVAQQFHHIMGLQPNFTHHTRLESVIMQQWTQSSHTVHIGEVCIWNNMDYLQMSITEKSGVEFSTGGSAFMVRIQHVYLLVCPVTDHFNGTYTVHCPMYGQICANISILIKHTNFSGFNGETTVLEKMIWEQNKICNVKRTKIIFPRVTPAKIHSTDSRLKQFVSSLPAPQSDDGHWFMYKEQWRFLGRQGQILPLSYNTTMCKCFSKVYKTYLLGASHQHINQDCLLQVCPGCLLEDIDTPEVRNIIPTLTNILSNITHEHNDSRHYQVIIQLGSWDLNKHDFQDVIYDWVPKLQSAMHDLLETYSALFQQHRVKILVMSSPALPDAQRIGQTIGPHVSRRVTRNNWISAVLALTLRQRMGSLGVDFLDEFAFTFPLYWYVYSWPRYPNHHYCMWTKAHQCEGHVGKAYLGLMASKICPTVQME